MPPRPLRIGTRGSSLALVQARYIARLLDQAGTATELVIVQTSGDRHRESIRAQAQTGVFTKELQQQLLSGEIDIAVHSLKDLPTEVDNSLQLAAVPPRERVHDVLFSQGHRALSSLKAAAKVGTGSLRRQAEVRRFRPDLRLVDLRGNIETRLQHVRSGQLDAVLLAAAGLYRLGMDSCISEHLDPLTFLPAVGQGALGLEIRADDSSTASRISPLCHLPSHVSVWAERSMLKTLRGGCLSPVGAWARLVADGRLQLNAAVLSPDGRKCVSAQAQQDVETAASAEDRQPAERAAEQLGIRVARELLDQGANELLGGRAQREPGNDGPGHRGPAK